MSLSFLLFNVDKLYVVVMRVKPWHWLIGHFYASQRTSYWFASCVLPVFCTHHDTVLGGPQLADIQRHTLLDSRTRSIRPLTLLIWANNSNSQIGNKRPCGKRASSWVTSFYSRSSSVGNCPGTSTLQSSARLAPPFPPDPKGETALG